MNFNQLVKYYLNETKNPDRVKAGYNSLAKSTGNDITETKKKLKELDKKGVTSKIKKNAKKTSNPEVYKWGVIRKILKGHSK